MRGYSFAPFNVGTSFTSTSTYNSFTIQQNSTQHEQRILGILGIANARRLGEGTCCVDKPKKKRTKRRKTIVHTIDGAYRP